MGDHQITGDGGLRYQVGDGMETFRTQEYYGGNGLMVVESVRRLTRM